MATKAEMAAELAALNVEVNPDDHKSDELQEMLEQAKANAQTEAPKERTYKVCVGKALTTLRRGMASEGDEVSAKDFAGGEDAIEDLYLKGIVEDL